MRHYGAERGWGARVDDAWTYRGLRTVVLENEVLRVVVLSDKGADVSSVLHKPTDTELLWRSPWGAREASTARPSAGDDPGMWLDHYEGGWQSLAPNAGAASDTSGGRQGMHAESSLLPWDVVVREEGPDVASVELRVRLLRTPLRMTRTMTLRSGSATLEFSETLVNDSDQDLPVSWNQHLVLGEPLLGPDSRIDLPGGVVRVAAEPEDDTHRLAPGGTSEWPWSKGRDGDVVDLRVVPPREAGTLDLAFVSHLPAPWYAVSNPVRGVGAAVRWSTEVYPHLWFWQVCGGGTGYPWWGRTYSLGLEPSTSATNGGLSAALADGSARVLGARESIAVDLQLTTFIPGAHGTAVADVRPDGTVVVKPEEPSCAAPS